MVRIACIILIFSLFLFQNISSADEIVLQNGDRLTGTVKSVENDRLTLETEYSDPITITFSKVKEIFTDTPVEVHLMEGEILKGRLRTVGEGEIVVELSAERRSAVIDWAKVKSINPPKKRWKGSVTVGANQQSGNTDRTSASVAAEAMRRAEKDRINLRLLFNYAEEDGKVTTRNTFGALKYDYFLNHKLYSYLSIELLSDEFRDLNLRTVVGPGIGYQLWDDENISLLFEAGVNYISEDLDKGEDDSWITGRVASDLKWQIIRQLAFSNYFLIYPTLEDIGEFQLRNEASISSPIAQNWSLKLTNILEHDSTPPENVEKSDINWILGVQYSF